MAGMSVLRAGSPMARLGILTGAFVGKLVRLSSPNSAVCIRQMGSHKRTIPMVPSNFEWRKWKDQAHFYLLLGVIPIAILISATNLFIGPAELADIPEGYEPKHWEYYKHPISRFISRYITESQEKIYERHLHFVAQEMEKVQLRKLESKVKLLVGSPTERYDSTRWYYIPPYEKASIAGKEAEEKIDESTGFK